MKEVNKILAEYRCYTRSTGQPYKWFLLVFLLPFKILSRQPAGKEVNPYMYTIF